MTAMPTPAQTAIAIDTARAMEAAAHGQGKAIVAAAAVRAGCSIQTLYAWMVPHRISARRRRSDYVARTDADAELTLTRADAELIAATLREGMRQTGKQILTLKRAVRILRADGHLLAAHTDPASGEVGAPLTDSAIARSLRRYGCHPEQLKRPSAHQPKRTLHPNHEWQVDASVCVVYYLPGGGAYVEELDQAVHYKNKPQNLEKIAQQRVIRYVLADHTTGVVRWRYYPHAESGAHTVAFLAWAIADKPDPLRDPFRGAPVQLLVDPGATASGTVARFCARLGIELIVTKRKNPRAKGSVEVGNNLIECGFESGLRYQRQRVRDFADLNCLAEQDQLYWNATAIHSRHGRTRFDAWMTILPEQLRLTEGESALRALATEHPATPRVQGDLTIAYKRGEVARWDVRGVPGVNVGDRIQILWSPLLGTDGHGQATAVTIDTETRRETYHPLAPIREDDWGFRADAPVSGEKYARMPETDQEATAKRLDRLASGTTLLRDDELARRRKDFRPLGWLDGGRGLNPFAAAEQAAPRTYLPRRGTAHSTAAAPRLEPVCLDHIAAAARLKPLVESAGGRWGPDRYAWLAARYPGGVPEEAIGALAEELAGRGAAGATAAPGLRIVRG